MKQILILLFLIQIGFSSCQSTVQIGEYNDYYQSKEFIDLYNAREKMFEMTKTVSARRGERPLNLSREKLEKLREEKEAYLEHAKSNNPDDFNMSEDLRDFLKRSKEKYADNLTQLDEFKKTTLLFMNRFPECSPEKIQLLLDNYEKID